jgi:hypothetical protein
VRERWCSRACIQTLAALGWHDHMRCMDIHYPRPPLLSNSSLNHMIPKCMSTYVVVMESERVKREEMGSSVGSE